MASKTLRGKEIQSQFYMLLKIYATNQDFIKNYSTLFEIGPNLRRMCENAQIPADRQQLTVLLPDERDGRRPKLHAQLPRWWREVARRFKTDQGVMNTLTETDGSLKPLSVGDETVIEELGAIVYRLGVGATIDGADLQVHTVHLQGRQRCRGHASEPGINPECLIL